MKKYLSIIEVSEYLQVSKHTVQAWISPSSPNYKQEFAYLAKHAGRKTLFEETDILTWLDQRRGPIYAHKENERSPYWLEMLLKSRGMLEGELVLPELVKENVYQDREFPGGILGVDTEPFLLWLNNSNDCNRLERIFSAAEGITISITLCHRILKQTKKKPSVHKKIKKFMLSDRIFEIAPFNENALSIVSGLPLRVSELNAINYSCTIANGANSFLTRNPTLCKVDGLPITTF